MCIRDRIDSVWGDNEKKEKGIYRKRAGNLVVTSNENSWFTYYYWLNDKLAPDFARCVDIHRKPGYDPVELFKDQIRGSMPRVMLNLLKKKFGFRMLMDIIPLDASLVKGSHGCRPKNKEDWPMIISKKETAFSAESTLNSTDVYGVLRSHILG